MTSQAAMDIAMSGFRLLLAAGIGTFSWVWPDAVALNLMLPWLLHAAPANHLRKWWPTWVALAWFAPGNLTLVPVVLGYFGVGDLALAISLPVALSVAQAAPFALLIRADAQPVAAMLRTLAALLLTVLPPLGLIFWRSPVLPGAVFAPGSGWVGIAMFSALMASTALGPPRGIGAYVRSAFTGRLPIPQTPRPGERAVTTVFVVCTLVGAGYIAALASGAMQRPRADYGWIAQNTQFGPAVPPPGQRGRQLAALLDQLVVPGVRGVVLPEGILSPLTPADEVVLSPVSAKARKLGVSVLIGVTTAPDHAGRWDNGIYAMGKANTGAGVGQWIDRVRVPMPAGNWRIGTGVPLRWLSGSLSDVDGTAVAFSMCYEDMILWPHRDALRPGRPAQMMVSVANQWAVTDTYAERVQNVSASLVARWLGTRMVRATNRWSGERE